MMNMRTLLLVSAILTGTTSAQDPVPTPPVGLPAPAGAEHWIQRLGNDSYRVRLEAENKLRELGGKAKKALEAAAKDESDSEVQWRAKRLLRLLRQLEKAELQSRKGKDPSREESGLVERRRPGGRGQGPTIERDARGRDVGGIDDMREQFDRLFRRMEEMHGLDVPRHRFFDDTFFQDLREQMRGGRMGFGPIGKGQIGKGPIGKGSVGSSKSVQIGPDGVRVEVTETGEDGKPETKVYDAPDMETFRKKHPGVLQESRGGLGLRMFGGGIDDIMDEMRVETGAPQRGFEWQLLKPRVIPFDRGFQPERAEGMVPAAPAPATGRRLGILVKPIPQALRDYLEMAPGIGLMVDSIQEDTLAEALRLRSGDIVTKINGSKIGSAEDVGEALGAIKKGDDVEVEFLRRGERREAKTKKQHDAVMDAKPVRGLLEPGKKKQKRESIR